MTDGSAVLVAVLAGLAGLLCAGGGLLAVRLVGRLPEPEPRPEPEPSAEQGKDEGEEAGGDGSPQAGRRPSIAEQLARDEDPKTPYAVLAREARFVRAVVLWAGLGGVVVGGWAGWSWVLLVVLPVVPVLAALGVVDARTRYLPVRLVLPVTGWLVVVGLLVGPLTGAGDEAVRALIGLVVGRSVYWVLWFVWPAGLAFGDVRLAAPLGFVLGWAGWAELAVGLYAPTLLFGLLGLALAVVRRDRSLLRAPRAFGPAMLLGALVGLVAGAPVVSALLGT
ncbi:MAG: prepilin peptidase [Nocardioides sp.]|nr:prepilin peptidase [Nocardioides sp.]